jgi:hypothetical protein
MTAHTLRRFSLVIDFIEPDPKENTPDRRARVLSEHDTAIRAAAERMTALLASDAQIATMLSAYGIQIRAVLSH